MSKAKSGFGLSAEDDTSLGHQPAAEPVHKPRQGDNGRPVCPDHHAVMTAYKTPRHSMYTYYHCTVEKCRRTAKRIRPVGPLKNLYGHGKSSAAARAVAAV
jgi:hypothetical protein